MPAAQQETLVILFTGEHKSGRRLFDGLLEANSTSFWNHSFMSAISALKYTGFVRPATLFVAAPPHHVESIRSAYAKRMLKAPAGVSIASLGEMGCMKPVQQLHFVPLSDAFCDAVAALNRVGRAATLGSVRDTIARQCSQLAPPTQEMLTQTANALAKEGVVARVGQHMFVTPAAPKTTVECQTGESMCMPPQSDSIGSEEKREKKREGILARLFTRKNTGSPCKGGIEKKRTPTPVPVAPLALPDWEYSDDYLQQQQQENFRPAVYSARPRTSRAHRTRRDEREQARHRERSAGVAAAAAYRTSSDEEAYNHRQQQKPSTYRQERHAYPHYPSSTNYGPIDPPESYERYNREQARRPAAVIPMSVPIPSKARASTPTSTDSAYSRSTSDQSDDNDVDHTYVNIQTESQMEETQFEECTLWNGPATPVVTVM